MFVVLVVVAVKVLHGWLHPIDWVSTGVTVMLGAEVLAVSTTLTVAIQPEDGSEPLTVKVFEPVGAPTFMISLLGVTGVPVVVILLQV
jgi:hypothetical protein